MADEVAEIGSPDFFVGGQNDAIKGMFASVEQSGNTTGDWLQLEESTFNDLKDRGKIRESLRLNDLQNPNAYDEVASAYINDLMTTHKIPTVEEAALWSWRPAWYRKRQGKIGNIPETVPGVAGKTAREVMTNRANSLNQFLTQRR